jgi:hypothetical protein
MDRLILHPRVKQQVEVYLRNSSHALLLIGPSGIGKALLARSMAETLLGLPPDGLAAYPYVKIVTPAAKKTIGIELIREIEHFLSLKVPASQALNRFILIEDSHTMTAEAQNALLKTIEEPPSDTFVIMTASNPQALLPTILSRVQRITLAKPARTSLEAHFIQKGHAEPAVQQSYRMSGGLPAIMDALLSQTDHPLLAATETARKLLNQTSYERLLSVDELSRQRELIQDILFIMQQMADLRLQTATGPALTRWKKVLTATYHASEALHSSAQPKLALTNLMLELS